jgi:hypothetical protein
MKEIKIQINSNSHRYNSLMEFLFENHYVHQIDDIDTCLRDGCDTRAQANYRLCPKHLREAHAEGFDDSNK